MKCSNIQNLFFLKNCVCVYTFLQMIIYDVSVAIQARNRVNMSQNNINLTNSQLNTKLFYAQVCGIIHTNYTSLRTTHKKFLAIQPVYSTVIITSGLTEPFSVLTSDWNVLVSKSECVYWYRMYCAFTSDCNECWPRTTCGFQMSSDRFQYQHNRRH